MDDGVGKGSGAIEFITGEVEMYVISMKSHATAMNKMTNGKGVDCEKFGPQG